MKQTSSVRAMLALSLSLWLAGCSEDLTEIMVVVHSDIPETQVDGVRFDVNAGGASHQRDVSFELGKPATLGVVRRDESIDEVHVVVHGMRGMNVATPEVSASARVGFVEGEVRVLTLYLREACVGHVCDDNGETCVAQDGTADCRDNRVNATDLPRWTGTPPGFDAGTTMPVDGGPRDTGGIDASFDAGPCTATSTEDTTCDGVDDDCDDRVDEDVDVSSDPTSCGACGVMCTGGAECHAGLCSTAAVAIAAGFEHSCATGLSGRAYCWGKGNEGRLGTGATTSSATPVEVTAFLEDSLELGAGEQLGCARVIGGAVWCWGDDGVGQLGNGPGGSVGPSLVELPMGTIATQLTVGFEHACVATSTGEAYCWGRNHRGQLGDGTMGDAQAPVLVSGLSGVTWIDAGREHTCAVTSDGAAHCWGDNVSYQLGSGVTGSISTPRMVTGLEPTAVSISAGDVSTCAVLASGAVRCWGVNGSGQIGDGSGDIAMIPRAVREPAGAGELSDAMYVSVGRAHACAVTLDGRVLCWGENDAGQLGLGAATVGTDSRAPVYVMGLSSVARVSAGTSHSCAIARDRTTVWCWGANNEDQVGNGSGDAVIASPVTVTFP